MYPHAIEWNLHLSTFDGTISRACGRSGYKVTPTERLILKLDPEKLFEQFP